jgi:hypothetical protein
MNKCDGENCGLAGCGASVTWILKGANVRMCACGRHLNNVCMQMVRYGLEYMTIQIVNERKQDATSSGPARHS